MDSVTQIVLGAAVGYVVAGKSMGRQAALVGAVAGLLPDLDFIPTLFAKDDYDYLNQHRALSHSVVGCLTLPFIFAWVSKKLRSSWPFRPLWWIYFWGFVTHIVLDCFTTWGTQVFWPFWPRVAWNTVFIIDPLYTLPLLFCLLAACFRQASFKRRKWVAIGLALSSFYLLWGIGVKFWLNPKFEALFRHHNINYLRYTTRPSAFNSVLWSTTAEVKDGYYIGFISLLDKAKQGPLFYIPKHHELNTDFDDRRAEKLLYFTKGYYTLEKEGDELLVHDLRYGTLGDPWQVGEAFVFTYRLSKGENGETLVKVFNPRPKNSNELLRAMWERLKGIK